MWEGGAPFERAAPPPRCSTTRSREPAQSPLRVPPPPRPSSRSPRRGTLQVPVDQPSLGIAPRRHYRTEARRIARQDNAALQVHHVPTDGARPHTRMQAVGWFSSGSTSQPSPWRSSFVRAKSMSILKRPLRTGSRPPPCERTWDRRRLPTTRWRRRPRQAGGHYRSAGTTLRSSSRVLPRTPSLLPSGGRRRFSSAPNRASAYPRTVRTTGLSLPP
jgi:hypothetical protein